MWLIGREWKYSDVRSGPVLIDRGLDLSREPVLKESETSREFVKKKHFYAVVRIRILNHITIQWR